MPPSRRGKLRRTVPTAEEVLGLALALETTIGQLLSPGDQDDLLAGIVSQADVLSIFSPPDEEIRREVTDRVILQGLLMDPDRLQVNRPRGIVTCPAGRKTTRSAETSSRPSGTSRTSSPSGTSGALRTTICTRPHPDDTCFTSL